MKEEISVELARFFYPVLLAIVTFFLIQFYKMVKDMGEKITNILIGNGKQDIKIENMEKRVEMIEEDIREIKRSLSDR